MIYPRYIEIWLFQPTWSAFSDSEAAAAAAAVAAAVAAAAVAVAAAVWSRVHYWKKSKLQKAIYFRLWWL